MKSSTQLKALIRNLAKEKNINAQILMRNYMFERLLEQISLSKYRSKFVLKGGMLVAAMVGLDARSTMDMDATIKGYPLSEERQIDIFAYNLETVLAEKLETIISRGTTNTRMMDFYDVFILLKMHSNSLNKELLAKALVSTAINRDTYAIPAEGQTIINEVSNDIFMQGLWENYRKKYSYAEDIRWDEVIAAVNEIWQVSKD